MKNTFLFLFLLITSATFAQKIKIDTVSIVKPGTEEVILDATVTDQLEKFNNQDDAIIYIYRLKSMAGSAVKWLIKVDDIALGNLKQLEYVVAHVDTKAKSHYLDFTNFQYNFVNFKPNHYYTVMLKGFSHMTGYLTSEAIEEIKSCKITPPLK
jgi:hypothetical protein